MKIMCFWSLSTHKDINVSFRYFGTKFKWGFTVKYMIFKGIKLYAVTFFVFNFDKA